MIEMRLTFVTPVRRHETKLSEDNFPELPVPGIFSQEARIDGN